MFSVPLVCINSLCAISLALFVTLIVASVYCARFISEFVIQRDPWPSMLRLPLLIKDL